MESSSRAQARLIVVDDEPVILELLTSVLSDGPWECVACADGAQALAAMDGGVDVLLTDKNLPDIGGLELVRQARKRVPDVECIVITGYGSLDTALEALHLEVFDYILKPPKDIFEVRRKVERAFERQRLERENSRLLSDLRKKNDELFRRYREMQSLQAEVVQSEKLAGIGTLAAGVAHEISSPLFGVMGLAEAIADEDDPVLMKEYAREIVEYSRTIKDIIGELSGYSRAAEHEQPEPIALSNAVGDAVKLVTRTAGSCAGGVTVALPPELRVIARASELQQVFVNLVKNAIEATVSHGASEGGVRIFGGEDERGIWAIVEDDGEGVPEERRSTVFDPFFTTKPPGQGTGLGLNIVYRLVTKYRGSITVDSAASGGASFTVRFPPCAE